MKDICPRPRMLCLSLVLAGLLMSSRSAKADAVLVAPADPPAILSDAAAAPVASAPTTVPTVYNSLTGATPPPPTITPLTWDYGTVMIGNTTTKTFTVKNNGYVSLTGTVSGLVAPFTLVTPAGGTYTAGDHKSTTLSIRFAPQAEGPFSKKVLYVTNGGTVTGTVSGVGLSPIKVVFKPASLDFGYVPTGETASASLLMTNEAGTAVTGAVSVGSARFTLSTNRVVLAGFASTSLGVTFTPVAQGLFSTNIVFSNALGTVKAAVSGRGAVAPSALFSATPTNGVWPLRVTFTDASTGTITNRVWDFGDGATTGTVATSLAHTYSAPGSYAVQLTAYGPTGESSLIKTNGVVVDDPPALLAATPASFNFGIVALGQSGSRTLTVVNNGGKPLNGTASVASPFAIQSGSPFSLDAGKTGTVTILFSPGITGVYSNNVVLTSNGGGASISVRGSGATAAELHVTPAGHDFGILYTGATARTPFILTNAGAIKLTGTVSVTPGPFSLSTNAFSLPGFGWTNLFVQLNPHGTGSLTGNVTFVSNGGGSTQWLSAVGTTNPPVIRFKVAAYSVVEGNTAKLVVQRTGNSGGAVSVHVVTKPATAISWSDFKPLSTTLTWADGDATPRVIRIPTNPDGLVEPNEVFKVQLNLPAGAIVGIPALAKVTILPPVAIAVKSVQPALSSVAVSTGQADLMALLTAALDGSGLTWFSSFEAPWTGETEHTADGADAAMSAKVAPGQVSWLETEVEGPGSLAFTWALNGDSDTCLFLDNGAVVRRLGDKGSWQSETVVLGSGRHTLRWAFTAGATGEPGVAFLDKVKWAPAN